MALDRWDPFRDMITVRDAMDRWLQQSISGTNQLLSNMRPESIPLDVIEHDEHTSVGHAVPEGLRAFLGAGCASSADGAGKILGETAIGANRAGFRLSTSPLGRFRNVDGNPDVHFTLTRMAGIPQG